MRGEDPSKDNGSLLSTERPGAQDRGRRDGGHPVQAEHHHDHQNRGFDRWPENHGQSEQREASKAVIDGKKLAGVESVREPTRAQRPDQVEEPHDGEKASSRGRVHSFVMGGGDEVRGDDPVGCPAADKESPRQNPEGAVASNLNQRANGCFRRCRCTALGVVFLGRRIVRIGAVGKKANITWSIDEDEPDDGYERERGDGDTPGGRSPSGGVDDVRDQGEEDELARRPGGTHHTEHQSTPLVEPTVDDQGAENQRRRSDAESDDDAPQDHQMPWVGHHGGQAGADRDQS